MPRKQRQTRSNTQKSKSSVANDGSNEEVLSKHFMKKEVKHEPKHNITEEITRSKGSLVKKSTRRKGTKTPEANVALKDVVVSKHFIKTEVSNENEKRKDSSDDSDDFDTHNLKKRKLSNDKKLSSKLSAAFKQESSKDYTCSSENEYSNKIKKTDPKKRIGMKRKLQKQDESFCVEKSCVESNKDHGKKRNTVSKRKISVKEETSSSEVKGKGVDSNNQNGRKKRREEGSINISQKNNETEAIETRVIDNSEQDPVNGVVKKKTKKKETSKKSQIDLKTKKTPKTLKGKQSKQAPENQLIANKEMKINPINSSDVMSVLMHMEGPSTSEGQGRSKVIGEGDEMMSNSDSDNDAEEVEELDSDDSEEDWEEVEDHRGTSPKKSQAPSQSVEITLEGPTIYKKRKRKGFDLNDYLKKQVNKFKKELAIDMHKVHLLCLISRGIYLNTTCQSDILRAQVMSIVMETRELTFPNMKGFSQGHLNSVLKWINREFVLTDQKSVHEEKHMETKLARCLESRSISNNTEFTLVCIMVLRHLGFMTRLVMSLQPIPYKQAQKGGSKASKSKKLPPKKTKPSKAKPDEAKVNPPSKSKSKVSKIAPTSNAKQNVKKKLLSDEKFTDKKTDSANTSKRGPRRCSKSLPQGAYKDGNDGNEDSGDMDEDVEFMDSDSSDSDSEDNVKIKKSGKNRSKQNHAKKSPSSSHEGKKEDKDPCSDSDFEQDSILMRTQPLRKEPSKATNRKVLSSDSDTASSRSNSVAGNDVWLEVYIEAENKWKSVCSHCKEVAKPADIQSHASFPLYYVVGVDNNGAIKDVTVRYASEWLTKTRKLRIDDDWWSDTLVPFLPTDKERDMAEDKDLQTYLLQCPLPSSISQFKGHPLYILKRHLLKYEALYPNSIVPVGYIRGEPVYSRDCCHTLHSRENWLKEGRSVRLGEDPYKFVKSRKRWNDKDSEPKDCELFGKWQTEIYMPPPAVDGVVPRNAHGNVEMFQPWMKPAGTVHLKGLPGLNRIARKLNLDCAPAMVGWDHHCGFAHPVMDGWIVCEEHKDVFLAAWDEEQEIIQEREIEKRNKRVYGNWKKLIRGLIIKERLKQRYEEKPIDHPTEEKQEVLKDPEEMATDVQQSWPQNRLVESKPATGVVEQL